VPARWAALAAVLAAVAAAAVVVSRPAPVVHTGSLLTTAGARASSVAVTPDVRLWRRDVTTVPATRPTLAEAGPWLLATAGDTTAVLDPADLAVRALLPALDPPAVGSPAVVRREGRALVQVSLPEGTTRLLATLEPDADVTDVAAWRDGAVLLTPVSLDALDGNGRPVGGVDLAGLPAPPAGLLAVLGDRVVLTDDAGGLHVADLAASPPAVAALGTTSGTARSLVREGAVVVTDDGVRDTLVSDLLTGGSVRIPHGQGDTSVRPLDVRVATVHLLAVRAQGQLLARTHRRTDGALLSVTGVRSPGGSASPFGTPPVATRSGVVTAEPTRLRLVPDSGDPTGEWTVEVPDLRGVDGLRRAVLVTTRDEARVLFSGDGAELARWPLVPRPVEAVRTKPGLRPLLEATPAGVLRRDALATDGDGLALDPEGRTARTLGTGRYGTWLVGDTVLSVVSGSLRGGPGGGEAALVATGPDGAIRWSEAATFDDIRTLAPVAAVDDRVLLALPGDGGGIALQAVDLATGRTVGQALVGLTLAALEARAGGRLVLSTADPGHGRRLTGIDLGDAGPRLVWDAPPLARGQRLHVVAGPDGPVGWEVGTATATPRSLTDGRQGTPVLLPARAVHAAAVDGLLLVTTGDARVLALDHDLTLRWEAVLPDRASAAPVVAGDEVLVGDVVGRVHRVRLADGTVRGSTDLGEGPVPVVAVTATGRTLVAATARAVVGFGPTLPRPDDAAATPVP
jgi:hypothetical protein